ncbi:MAG: gfo/Idh/MocA family oxidoreductase [Planctomycetota bacterium]|nr:gfo/Idh/MocA family oxidoreductase [Planctomycetota bacterium]
MTKDDRLLRIGVLGCGPISQFAHFDATRKARNVDLYAICDLAPDLADRMAAVHRPKKVYYDFDAMLADPQVDAIIVAIADQFHVAACRKAIAAGKHVLVEKPLGTSIEECEALRVEVHASKLVLQVGNNRRFDPGVAFAARFIREEMGGVMAVKAWYCDSTHRYAMTDNLQPIPILSENARKPAGNPKADRQRYFVLGHGSHLVDTARFLGGAIESIHARHLEKFGAHTWFVEVGFANGALGHLDLTIPIRGDFQEGFQVYGEHGSATGKVFLPWFHKSSEVECFSERDRTFRRPLGEDSYSYKRQIEGFAATILDGAPMTGATVDDGTAAMRAMVAIARSAENGKALRLDEMTGGV